MSDSNEKKYVVSKGNLVAIGGGALTGVAFFESQAQAVNLTADQALTQIDGVNTTVQGLATGAFTIAIVIFAIHYGFHSVKRIISAGG